MDRLGCGDVVLRFRNFVTVASMQGNSEIANASCKEGQLRRGRRVDVVRESDVRCGVGLDGSRMAWLTALLDRFAFARAQPSSVCALEFSLVQQRQDVTGSKILNTLTSPSSTFVC